MQTRSVLLKPSRSYIDWLLCLIAVFFAKGFEELMQLAVHQLPARLIYLGTTKPAPSSESLPNLLTLVGYIILFPILETILFQGVAIVWPHIQFDAPLWLTVVISLCAMFAFYFWLGGLGIALVFGLAPGLSYSIFFAVLLEARGLIPAAATVMFARSIVNLMPSAVAIGHAILSGHLFH